MPFRSLGGDGNQVKLCVVVVGLPARGKSFISQKVLRYLSWLSINAKVFNVGNYRYKAGYINPSAEFFRFENPEGVRVRERAATDALQDMLAWFEEEEGAVGILDATNSTVSRRQWVREICSARGIEVMYLESWCDNAETVEVNIRDIARTSPDYKESDAAVAERDLRRRIGFYEKVYETLDSGRDRALTFVKLVNINEEVLINRIQTYLQSRIVFYVMNIRPKPRTIWLSRHGESIYNVEKKIGGDSLLSPRGAQYALKLKQLVQENVCDGTDLTVWTSTLKRTQQTAQHLAFKQLQWKALDELDAGVCDGMTYEEIELRYPDDFRARDDDKYGYRYRGGESYRDVVIRLEPVIMELERQENILIITHQAVLRCIYAYFMNVPQQESPWMSIPLHTLIKLEPRAYGTKVTKIEANIPAVSTYKGKGTSQVGENPAVPGTAHPAYQTLLTDAPHLAH